MFNNYNIYDKINIILNVNINNTEILCDDFFNYIFENYMNTNKNNINVTDMKNNLGFNNKNNKIENNIIHEQYYLVKKLYKKLCLKFHPDKKGDPSIFIKVSEYYENDFLIGLLSICYNHNINIPELTCVDERKILNEFIFLLNQLHIYK